MTETLYVERANGRFEAWTYSDGNRVFITFASNIMSIYAYAKRHGFHVQHVK